MRFFSKHIFWFILLPAALFGQENLQKIQKHFEWGEYDSLKVHIPPILEMAHPDSLKARLHKYLGIAAFMKGDSAGAESSLFQGFQLNADTVLNPVFLSDSARAYFSLMVEKWKITHPVSLKPDTNVGDTADTGGASEPALPGIGSSDSTKKEGRSSGTTFRFKPVSLSLSAGSFVVSGILGYFTIREYRLGKVNFTAYEKAAADGSPEVFNKKKQEVEENDFWTVVYGSSALITAISGVYFLVRGISLEKSGQAQQAAGSAALRCNFSFVPSGAMSAEMKLRF